MTSTSSINNEQKLQAQPLYARVQQALVDRLIEGSWKPGQMLPSEFAIADQLGVSQGTVRKALDDMTTKGLLVRKQGRGTFVAEAEDKSILFRFYRLTRDENENTKAQDSAFEHSFPDSEYISSEMAPASAQEQAIFETDEDSQVWRFVRVRRDHIEPILWEELVLPAHRFPNLEDQGNLPNNVYQFYGNRYGIIVARVQEQLRAIAANEDVAKALNLETNAPVLEIDRRAFALDGSIVEWRRSFCRSDTIHYRNELR